MLSPGRRRNHPIGWPDTPCHYRVVPLPREITMTAAAEGFKLLPTTKIAYSKGDEQQKKNAELLAEYIGGLTGLKLQITTKMPRANAIVLSADLAGENPEAYALTVTNQSDKKFIHKHKKTVIRFFHCQS